MDIVVSIDKWYVMPTGVMAYSVCCNNQDIDIVFHFIVDESVTEKDKDDLKRTIYGFKRKRVVFYLINSEIVNQYPNHIKDGPTLATYYRLFLTEIIPNTIDKVLYLDGDIIVRKQLLPLWNVDLANNAIAAVSDISPDNQHACNRLDYAPSLGYVNAGVLLINLQYWREHNASNMFSEYIESHYDKIVLHDQDVLNYVFRDNKIMLPYEYNFQQDYLLNEKIIWNKEAVYRAKKDPVIVHFSGPIKPWFAYIRDSHPFGNSFYKYQSGTMWKGERLEKRPLKLIIKNAMADILRKTRIIAPLDHKYIYTPPID